MVRKLKEVGEELRPPFPLFSSLPPLSLALSSLLLLPHLNPRIPYPPPLFKEAQRPKGVPARGVGRRPL